MRRKKRSVKRYAKNSLQEGDIEKDEKQKKRRGKNEIQDQTKIHCTIERQTHRNKKMMKQIINFHPKKTQKTSR